MVIFLSSIGVLVSFGLVSMYILLHFVHNELRGQKKKDELGSLVHSMNLSPFYECSSRSEKHGFA